VAARHGVVRRSGKMDKCTYCAGGPEADGSKQEFQKYGANRLADGKLPLCAEMCSTKLLLAGDGDIVAQIYKERVLKRGCGSGAPITRRSHDLDAAAAGATPGRIRGWAVWRSSNCAPRTRAPEHSARFATSSTTPYVSASSELA
jgi:hypothetical protein